MMEQGDGKDQSSIDQRLRQQLSFQQKTILRKITSQNGGEGTLDLDDLQTPANDYPKMMDCQDINTICDHSEGTQSSPNIDVFFVDIAQYHANDQNYLFLFGILQGDKRVSIRVTNLKRTLYFVLRQDANTVDAKLEIDYFLNMRDIRQFESKFVDMKYVFELRELPRGNVKVYEVRFEFDSVHQLPPPESQGLTFKYVIGTTYTKTQTFIIRNGIKGPQWLSIPRSSLKPAFQMSVRYTWGTSQLYQLCHPESIESQSLLEKSPPKLSVMSISLKACKPVDVQKLQSVCPNKQRNTFMVYTLSYVFVPRYNFESRETVQSSESVCYYIGSMQRNGFKSDQFKFKEVKDQTQLLTHFLNRVSFLDPDILVYHDGSVTLDFLTARLCDKKINQLSRIGRIVCTEDVSVWREPQRRLAALVKGRIIVDTSRHAQDLVKANDYKLSTLSTKLRLQSLPQLNYQQTLDMMQKSELDKLCIHTYKCASNTLRLLYQLEILETSLRLTNICGYIWQKTLSKQRSQRNQYLIMHHCFKEGYLIPDKFYNDNELKTGKYEGGRVLQPKKGLHTGNVMLLDFVSLYPSIIREYNICFSTVERNLMSLRDYIKIKTPTTDKDPDQIVVSPLPPAQCVQSNWGLIPKLIQHVVTEREKYKTLMKMASDKEKTLFDTTQKAYKLVANSLYGCLGFQKSRFYARDLAALITSLGRKALESAETLVQNFSQGGHKCFQIVYGDTDSLMIKILPASYQSTEDEMQRLLRLSKQVTTQINNGYSVIRMEVDGVFNSILLLAKKKYAGNKLANLADFISMGSSGKVVPIFRKEYKGVEAIRGDSSGLLKEVSARVFNILFQCSENRRDVSHQLYRYFEQQHQVISKDGHQSYNKYVLTNTLNKHPVQYKTSKGLPHVTVAMQLIKQGHRADSLVNHNIEYIMVKTEEGNQPVSVNSYLKSQQAQNPMEINKQYYKQVQILPVVKRILAEIAQVDFQVIKRNFLHLVPAQIMSQQPTNYRSHIADSCPRTIEMDNMFNQIFGFLQCPKCNRNHRILRAGQFTQNCQSNGCEFSLKSLVPLIVNKIYLYIYDLANNFYREKMTCSNCGRVSQTVTVRCYCKSTQFQPDVNLSQSHDALYVIRRIIVNRLSTDTDSHHFQSLVDKIDEFLSASKYESIGGTIFTRLKLRR